MSGTRNAYDSLTRLREDTEAELRVLRQLVAMCVPTLTMDHLTPMFDVVKDTLRHGCAEVRADLDALHVEMLP